MIQAISNKPYLITQTRQNQVSFGSFWNPKINPQSIKPGILKDTRFTAYIATIGGIASLIAATAGTFLTDNQALKEFGIFCASVGVIIVAYGVYSFRQVSAIKKLITL